MAAPNAPHAIPYRAFVRHPKGPLRPFTLGKIFSFGTFTLSKTSSPVADARRLHLPCVVGVLKPSIPLSTTRPLMSPASSFAHTTATCAYGALEIHILLPFRMTWSPASFILVSIPAGLLPWSGSVKPKQPSHSPLASLGKNLVRCSSLPYW